MKNTVSESVPGNRYLQMKLLTGFAALLLCQSVIGQVQTAETLAGKMLDRLGGVTKHDQWISAKSGRRTHGRLCRDYDGL